MLILRYRTIIFFLFAGLFLASIYFTFQIRYSYEVEQFFPQGDPDLDFYRDFIRDFEADDNFLLVAIEHESDVFNIDFLQTIHSFTNDCAELPQIINSQSITKMSYPLVTPLGISSIPLVHLDEAEKLSADKKRLLQDPRFVNKLLASNGKSLVIVLKTEEKMKLAQSGELIRELKKLIASYSFDTYHILGRAYFQSELSELQKKEVLYSTIVSILLVAFIMILIFRKWVLILIAMGSIALGFLLFLGLMGALGREFNAMSAVYPVLMLIVGTSDVVHIMTKYIDEIKKGRPVLDSLSRTIREIGLATLLTSLTTAIGFAVLMSSKIGPVKDFGLNAALGVLVAYITVILVTTSLLSLCTKAQLIRSPKTHRPWEYRLVRLNKITKQFPARIYLFSFASLIICCWGISLISTNYKIQHNLPRRTQIKKDFHFFEENYAGFRSLEYAILPQGDFKPDDFRVLVELEKFEQKLQENENIRSVNSITDLYKSAHSAYNQNDIAFYKLPKDPLDYEKYNQLFSFFPSQLQNVVVSKDKKKGRLSAKILDIGADNTQKITAGFDKWIENNIDSNVVRFKRTGTGLIIDKNAQYIRGSLVNGLGMAIILVCLLMGFLFKNIKMVIISLLPNLFPLLVTAAILGFFSIELESGLSIVFAIVFGIAVDDTIHFLSRFKLSMTQTHNVEEALAISFKETGKAIILSSIILFFGFLVLLFSSNPASVKVGILIAFTLVSAILADLILLPVLIRSFYKHRNR